MANDIEMEVKKKLPGQPSGTLRCRAEATY